MLNKRLSERDVDIMAKVPVSVCIIAKNEEKHIEECLKRLKPYGFEIIVTDTGSTDNTKQIAKKYADKVLDFEWIDDFSAARNFCASHATNKWILALDCDEYVNHIDVQLLRMYMQKFTKLTGALRLTNLMLDSDGRDIYNTDDVIRFYNKNYYGYDFAIHEQVCFKNVLEREQRMESFLLPIEVIHHGYALSEEDMRVKQERNLKLLYKDLEKHPNNAYSMFQAGQSEYIIGNCDKAIELYQKALKINDSSEYYFVQVMITSLAKVYLKKQQYEDALELMNRYSSKCKSAKFVFTYALTLLKCNQHIKALLFFVKATTLPDKDTLGENLKDCYYNIIAIYEQMGNMEMANVFYDKYVECCEEKRRIIGA